MLNPSNLHGYQRKAVLHQLMCPDSMLWLGMGLGKSAITLTTIEHRMRAGQVRRTLIVAPLRVCHAVWEKEARKWSHTQHLRFAYILGAEGVRMRQLFSDADIYLVNYENLAWLSVMLERYYLSQNKPLPFDMCVYDEVSKMKNSQAQRMKGGKKKIDKGKSTERDIALPGWRYILEHFKYRTGLTGTPAANGYLDLFGQYLAVDNGERLGRYVSHFRDAFFTTDWSGFGYTVSPLGKQCIESKIGDITVKMDAEDYLELPPVMVNDILVDLPATVRQQYEEVEQDMFTRLDDGTEIELFNRASVSNKCLQFCNGSPYLEPMKPEFVELHDAKLDALEDILEEAAGQCVLLAYTFRADAQRIMKRFKSYRPINLTDTPAKNLSTVIADTVAGKNRLLIGHPASIGHGIDGLQDGCHIVVWFGLNWSLELYEQTNKRVERQGQKVPVTIHRILCRDTLDLVVSDALRRKDTDQTALKDAIQRYRAGLIPKDGALSFL